MTDPPGDGSVRVHNQVDGTWVVEVGVFGRHETVAHRLTESRARMTAFYLQQWAVARARPAP